MTNNEERLVLNVEVVDEQHLPQIIKDEVDTLKELEKRVKESNEAAVIAKQQADKIEDGVKFGKKKAAIEELQEATKSLANAQEKSAIAQDLSFQFHQKLAATSKYLFGLGVRNIAMNKSVVRQLEMQVQGMDQEELDELVCQEMCNIIEELKTQEDIMIKQEKLSELVGAMDDELEEQEEKIAKNAKKNIQQDEVLKKQGEKIAKNAEKNVQQDEAIKKQEEKIVENARKNEMQDEVINERIRKDEEHDFRLEELVKKDEEYGIIIHNMVQNIDEHTEFIQIQKEKNQNIDKEIDELISDCGEKANKKILFVALGISIVSIILDIVSIFI